MIHDYEVKTKADLKKFLTQEVKKSPNLKDRPADEVKKVVNFTVNKMKSNEDVEVFMRGFMGKPKLVKRSDPKNES